MPMCVWTAQARTKRASRSWGAAFFVNFCMKWLLRHVHVHFDCAGSHKTGVGADTLYRDLARGLLQRSCQQNSYREFVQRSCQETSYRDLLQRSCQDTFKRSLTEINRALIEILYRSLYRNLAKIPLTGSLYRNFAKIPLLGSLYRNLAKRPLIGSLYRNLAKRPLIEIFCRDLARIPLKGLSQRSTELL